MYKWTIVIRWSLLLSLSAGLAACQAVPIRTSQDVGRVQVERESERRAPEVLRESEDLPEEAPTPIEEPPPPRIGVLLGPGGMRVHAHIGVLKEMHEARWPIEVIAGLEWAAPVAFLYAQNAQINDLEWQFFKLREEDVIARRFLGSQIRSRSPQVLDSFLTEIFSSNRVDQTQIQSFCPAWERRSSDIRWMERGRLSDAVKRCIALPPLFDPYDRLFAAAFSVEESIQRLRAQGAEYIVYVDLLTDPIETQEMDEKDQLLWSVIRAGSVRVQGADAHIQVRGLRSGLLDHVDRRRLMQRGSAASRAAIRQISEELGL